VDLGLTGWVFLRRVAIPRIGTRPAAAVSRERAGARPAHPRVVGSTDPTRHITHVDVSAVLGERPAEHVDGLRHLSKPLLV